MEKKYMSLDEKMDAIKMRIEGKTYQEIANKHGYSRQAVQNMMRGLVNDPKFMRKTVYSGLNEWMIQNECTISALARGCGIPYATMNVYMHQPGRMKLSVIKAILKYTGMTFEEAFGKEGEG